VYDSVTRRPEDSRPRRCGRGVNEKLGRRKLATTLFDDKGNLGLRDDVLYV
jgi:hypothetical protein